jgi:membrane-anchored protein YejM (alkaline phosphatase superfamily)
VRVRAAASAGPALRAALPVWLLGNVAAGLVIAHGYVAAAGVAPSWEATAYAYLAFAAPLVAMAALLGVPSVALSMVPGGTVLVRWIAPVVAAALLGFLWVDRAAFATYRFHVVGLAWNAVALPDGLAELGVRPASPGWLLAAVAGVAALDGLALHLLARRASRSSAQPARRWGWFAAGALALLVLERGSFLAADHSGHRDVVRMLTLVPFYSTLINNDLRDTVPALAGAEPRDGVRPPPPVVDFAAGATRSNVLWIVLDSWRADAMTPELTPVVSALGDRSTVFRNHTSGGDATRYGLTSMLYGVPASLWSRLELEGRSPPLLATLRDHGWRLGVFTSIDMPDVLSVIFADVPPPWRLAAPPARSGRKDRSTVESLERFLAQPRDGTPFFAFVHLISTHFPYDASCRLPLAGRGRRAQYDRAIRCADRLVARALRAVSLADTIVIVTADHGEAFGENGVFGHATGFTLPQLRVPLVFHVPGRPPAVVERPTTHHDMPATLLRLLGAAPSRADGIGRSLFEEGPPPRLFACNMNECAIHDADGSVKFGVGTRYPRELEIRDRAGRRIPADGEVGRRRFAQVLDLLALQRDALP